MSRSSMVHAAKQSIPGRFALICTAAKLARLIHVTTYERMADTINHALLRISRLEHQDKNSSESNHRCTPQRINVDH